MKFFEIIKCGVEQKILGTTSIDSDNVSMWKKGIRSGAKIVVAHGRQISKNDLGEHRKQVGSFERINRHGYGE